MSALEILILFLSGVTILVLILSAFAVYNRRESRRDMEALLSEMRERNAGQDRADERGR